MPLARFRPGTKLIADVAGLSQTFENRGDSLVASVATGCDRERQGEKPEHGDSP